MGHFRDGCIVSGIGIVAAAGVTAGGGGGGGGGGGALSCSVTFSGGAGTTNVSGASGYAPGIVQTSESGGTPPYTVTTLGFEDDPSGKLSLVDIGNVVIAYSGFSVNEIESGGIRYSITDSLGATATARFPTPGPLGATRNLSIKRTS